MSLRRNVADVRRRQIIEAARRMILKKGYHRVTIQDIAEDAGVSTGIPHHYFATRDSLLVATLQQVAEDMRRMVAEHVDKAPTPRAKLEAYVATASPKHDAIRDGWLVWLEYWADAIRDPRLAEFHHRRYAWWRDKLGGIIREGIADGSFQAVPIDDTVHHLIGLVDGLSIQASLHDASVTPEVCEQIALEFIRTRLCAPALAAAE